MPLSEEQLARLRADADTMAVEMSAKSKPPTLTEQMQDAVAPLLLRRIMSGGTFSGSEKLLEMLGAKPLPEAEGMAGKVGNFALETAGSFLGGGAVGAPVRMAAKAGLARLLPSLATQAPRLTRAGLGMAENAAIGGVAETFQGGDAGDIAGRAGLEAAVGGAMEVPMSAMGLLASRGMRWVAGPKTPKGKIDPTLARPFERPNISDWDGMNNGLVKLAEREGIPVIPEAVRPEDSLPYRMAIKLKHGASMRPYLAEQNNIIEKRVQNWKTRIVESIRDPTVVGGPEDHVRTGEVLQGSWSDLVDTQLRGEAGALYEKALAEGLGDFSIRTDELAAQLARLIHDEGFDNVPSPGVGKVRNLVERLRTLEAVPQESYVPSGSLRDLPKAKAVEPGPGPPAESMKLMSFNELWHESQNLYPKKKTGWDAGDYLASKAQRTVKNFIRNEAAEVHPQGEALLSTADVKWSRAHQLEDSDMGKLMRAEAHPEKVVDGLARDITMLRQVRADMGDEFADQLAQRKIATLFDDATNTKTGELDPQLMSSALKKIGGTHGNIDSEYMRELLKTKPEVHQALDELHGLLKMYEEPRRLLRHGGDEPETAIPGVPILMSAIDRAFVVLFNFATGSQVAKLAVAPRAVNPLLGGVQPAMPDASALLTMMRTLRRGTAAMGAGEAAGGLFPE